MSKYRTETDTLGPVEIPANALWGPQTERSRHNFQAGPLMQTINCIKIFHCMSIKPGLAHKQI